MLSFATCVKIYISLFIRMSVDTFLTRLDSKVKSTVSAVAWIDKEKNGIESREHSVNKPGMCQYFQNSNGKEFLNTTKTVCKCLIFDENVWNSSNEAVSFGPRKVLVSKKWMVMFHC